MAEKKKSHLCDERTKPRELKQPPSLVAAIMKRASFTLETTCNPGCTEVKNNTD